MNTENLSGAVPCPVQPYNPIAARLDAIIRDIDDGRLAGSGKSYVRLILHMTLAALRWNAIAALARAVCAIRPAGLAGSGLDVTGGEPWQGEKKAN